MHSDNKLKSHNQECDAALRAMLLAMGLKHRVNTSAQNSEGEYTNLGSTTGGLAFKVTSDICKANKAQLAGHRDKKQVLVIFNTLNM